MNLSENSESFFIDDLPLNFSVIAGFSKPIIEGVNVKSNIERLLGNCDVSYLNQIHSSSVCYVDKAGIYTADGLLSRIKNLVLVVKTADCMPLFIFDNKNKKIGVIHMGWRSALAGIVNNIGTDLKHSYVVAGVGLRKCCYEVGEEFLHIDKLAPFLKERKGAFYLDIISFAKDSLLRRGLKENNFYDSGICSFCHKDNFFSYRRNKTKKRTLSFAVIR